MQLENVTLVGPAARLEPMSLDHVDGLVAAANEDRTAYGYTEVPSDPTAMSAHVEIGGTWLAASAQRSGINTDAKRLMLTHAFETWGVQRVDLKTDARNERSRAAIERIGGQLDGVMRNWQPSLVPGEEGQPRDTAMYSIIPTDWPAIRERLLAMAAVR